MSRQFLLTSTRGIDWYMHDDGETTRYEAVSPTEAILDRNKAELTHNDGYSPSREMRRVARIPYIVGLQWLNDEGWWFEDPANANKLADKLNSSEWAHLRTAEGHLGVSNGVMR